MSQGIKLLPVLITGIMGHFIDIELCPMNSEMCGWNYMEEDGEAFCYKPYVHPKSAKNYEAAVAQCEAMSQVRCMGEMMNANDSILSAIILDVGLTDGTFYFNSEPGPMPAKVDISGSFWSITTNLTPNEKKLKQNFICKSCALSKDITTSKAPIITSKAPIVTSKAPVVTSKAPVVTSKAPAITSKAPVITSKAPAVTSKVPVITSNAPVITSKAPAVTSKAPVITSKAPVVTSMPPIVTPTVAPPICPSCCITPSTTSTQSTSVSTSTSPPICPSCCNTPTSVSTSVLPSTPILTTTPDPSIDNPKLLSVQPIDTSTTSAPICPSCCMTPSTTSTQSTSVSSSPAPQIFSFKPMVTASSENPPGFVYGVPPGLFSMAPPVKMTSKNPRTSQPPLPIFSFPNVEEQTRNPDNKK